MKRRCPHDDVQFCPLYVASHEGKGGCDDGHLAEMSCAVDRRKMDYAKSIEALDVFTVAYCARREREAQAKEQRARNLRINGIH